MSGEDFSEKANKHWRSAIFKTFGSSPDRWTEVRGAALTLRTVSPFLYGHMAHAFLPRNGGVNFEAVAHGVEPSTLEFRNGEVFYVMKVEVLRFGYVKASPEDSFFLLDAAQLEATGTQPDRKHVWEELTEHPPRSLEYIDQRHAMYGIAGYDDDGSEIALPTDCRKLMRYTSGRFMIASEGSMWNADEVSDDTYQAAHEGAEPEEIMEMIEAAVARGRRRRA